MRKLGAIKWRRIATIHQTSERGMHMMKSRPCGRGTIMHPDEGWWKFMLSSIHDQSHLYVSTGHWVNTLPVPWQTRKRCPRLHHLGLQGRICGRLIRGRRFDVSSLWHLLGNFNCPNLPEQTKLARLVPVEVAKEQVAN